MRIEKPFESVWRLEHRNQPLLPWDQFLGRMGRSFQVGASIVAVCLLIGVLGYHFLGHLHWLDALVNAAMILGGLGPVEQISRAAGKEVGTGSPPFIGAAG